jgi:hypothetical protein
MAYDACIGTVFACDAVRFFLLNWTRELENSI